MKLARFIVSRGNIYFLASMISFACNAGAQAQTVQVPVEEKKIIDDKKAKDAAEAPGGANDKALLDKYFGAGVFANMDTGNMRRVKNARVVNNVVRIEEESRSQLGFVLEAHKFLVPPDGNRFAQGPFVGLVMTGDNGIDAGILGWMFGFRQPNSTQSLNLGIGASITPKAQMLGDGVIANQPLPTGETEVRYIKRTKYGIAVIVSFGF